MTERATHPGWRVARRYAAYQLPGQLFVLGLALAAWEWFGAPDWLAWAAPLAWVVKDAMLFPFVWRSYEPDDAVTSDLLGQIAVSDEALDPAGWVRLGPELWRALVVPGGGLVLRGAKVRVVGVEGLVLHVEPLEPGIQRGAAAPAPSTSARSSSTQSS